MVQQAAQNASGGQQVTACAGSCRNSAPDHRGKLISADLFPGEVCTLLAYSWVLVFSSLVLRVSSCLALMSMTVAWPAQWLWADLHILVS